MRVAADSSRDVLLLREGRSAHVVAREGLAGIEDLDAVDVLIYALEHRTPDVESAIAAEWVRYRDETALIVDTRDRLFRGQAARDLLLEEETDDLAVPAADFLTHDHPKAVGQLAEPQRALDRVVIGRADDVQPRGLDRGGLPLERRAAVGRVLAVRMHVDPQLLGAVVTHARIVP